MPEVRKIKIDIPKDSILSNYIEQLGGVIKEDVDKETVAFRCQVFDDCLKFLKNELKTEEFPLVKLEFINKQSEYEIIIKQTERYERERVKTTSLAFAISGNFFDTIYMNMEQFFKLLQESKKTFVFHLIQIYLHELLHCFYGNLKNEQEIHNAECEMLEKFSGITLPDEVKQLEMSEFYQDNKGL